MDRRLKGCTYNIFKYTFCPISHFAILDGSESGECFLFFPLCCVQFLSFVSWSCSLSNKMFVNLFRGISLQCVALILLLYLVLLWPPLFLHDKVRTFRCERQFRGIIKIYSIFSYNKYLYTSTDVAL